MELKDRETILLILKQQKCALKKSSFSAQKDRKKD